MSELHSLAALRQAADHLRAEERHWWADTIMAAIETLASEDSAVDAVERVRKLHRPTDVDVLQSDCAAEDCEHEDECPTIERTVCKACYILGESIDIYGYERGGIEYVYYPCPTIQALDGGGTDE